MKIILWVTRLRPLRLVITILLAVYLLVLYLVNIPYSAPDYTVALPVKTLYEAGHINVNISCSLCPNLGKNLELLIVIMSAPWNEDARMDIRQTWGRFAIQKHTAIGFILGSTLNTTLSDNIDKEQYTYKDIIRGKVLDSLMNITLKIISMLEWVKNCCPKASFVFKADDDMFINIPNLYRFISKLDADEPAIYGRLQHKSKPIRYKSKYYISKQAYKDEIFPNYTAGGSYLFPARLSKSLYLAALNTTYLKFEDVFLTGIIANDLKIKSINAPEFHMERVFYPLTICEFQRGISVHLISAKGEKQMDLWKRLPQTADLGNFAECETFLAPFLDF